MNAIYTASFFSVLTLMASTGIILFMRAIRLANMKAIKRGFYLIILSFLCGALMMGWVISTM
jgi:hypothetical protein